MFIVFTNNSVVADFFEQKGLPVEIKWVAAPAINVLEAAKSAASLGAVILSNPMVGIRTTQPLFGPSSFEKPPSTVTGGATGQKIRSINPYISVLAAQGGGTVDFVSVKNIDEALTLYKKNARLRFTAHTDDSIKAFQANDLETLLATLTALQEMSNPPPEQ